ncbi:MAG: tetratricopeptide repeat protein [bacterium]
MNDTRTPPWAAALHTAQQLLERGDAAGALPHFEEAAGGALLFGSAEGEMTAQAGLAMALFGLGRAGEAIAPAKRAAALAEQLGQKAEAGLFRSLVQRLEADRGEQARSPWFTALTAGQTALEKGEIDEAVPHLEQAARRAAEAGAHGAEATACSLLAQTHLALQQPDDAIAPARRALALAQQLGQADAVAAFERLVDAALTAQERTRRMEATIADARAVLARAEAAEAAQAAAQSEAHEVAQDATQGAAAEPEADAPPEKTPAE